LPCSNKANILIYNEITKYSLIIYPFFTASLDAIPEKRTGEDTRNKNAYPGAGDVEL